MAAQSAAIGVGSVTIVALARKLLVALWKYVTAGVVIEGAIVKSA
jgi:transposase